MITRKYHAHTSSDHRAPQQRQNPEESTRCAPHLWQRLVSYTTPYPPQLPTDNSQLSLGVLLIHEAGQRSGTVCHPITSLSRQVRDTSYWPPHQFKTHLVAWSVSRTCRKFVRYLGTPRGVKVTSKNTDTALSTLTSCGLLYEDPLVSVIIDIMFPTGLPDFRISLINCGQV